MLVTQLCIEFRTWFHYPVWIKGEALRQILVNRYYGNIRPSGRRESLTSFGNGPLSPGGPGKPGGGGRLCGVQLAACVNWVCHKRAACMGLFSRLKLSQMNLGHKCVIHAICFVFGPPSHWCLQKFPFNLFLAKRSPFFPVQWPSWWYLNDSRNLPSFHIFFWSLGLVFSHKMRMTLVVRKVKDPVYYTLPEPGAFPSILASLIAFSPLSYPLPGRNCC